MQKKAAEQSRKLKDDAKQSRAREQQQKRQVAAAKSLKEKVSKALLALQRSLTNPSLCFVPEPVLEPVRKSVQLLEDISRKTQHFLDGKTAWDADAASKIDWKQIQSTEKLLVSTIASIQKAHK